ncbi:MAG TPA: hypothetical protein VM124_02320 [Candidatus Limnocylindrales bacterium]|nr:hypothetical protein [Candidatus Limnocylindrales bacterium]
MKTKRLHGRYWLIFVATLVLAAVLLVFFLQRTPLIPDGIRKQVSFVILYPEKKSQTVVDRPSLKYDSGQHTLSYRAKVGSGNLVISEQPTPENFTDIPQLYDKVLEQMHSYESLDTRYGKVALTKPDTSNNNQVGVINTNGTLMFVRAEQDLTTEQWRQFFNSLQLITP